jgi:hypothetical protein
MSKGNQGVYGFLVWSGEGLFAKYRKYIQFILSTIKTYRLPSK